MKKDAFLDYYEIETRGAPAAPYYRDAAKAASAAKAHAIALTEYRAKHDKTRRAPDAFMRWYLEQTAVTRNKLRDFAIDNLGFQGARLLDISSLSAEATERIMQGKRLSPGAEQGARFEARLKTFCAERLRHGDKTAFRMFFAVARYQKKHPKRQRYEIDSRIAAMLLGISKRAFEKCIERGEYTPALVGRVQVNPRVVTYDGNVILAIAHRKLARSEARKPKETRILAQHRPGD